MKTIDNFAKINVEAVKVLKYCRSQKSIADRISQSDHLDWIIRSLRIGGNPEVGRARTREKALMGRKASPKAVCTLQRTLYLENYSFFTSAFLAIFDQTASLRFAHQLFRVAFRPEVAKRRV